MFNRSRTILRVTALAGCVFAGATLYGCSGGDSGGADTPKKMTTGDVGGSGSAQGGMQQVGLGGGGQMGQMMGGGMGGGGGSQGASGAAMDAKADKSMPPHRVDPFRPTWPPPPPPNVLSMVAPVRIADRGTAIHVTGPEIEIHEVPQMRVAGILSGSGIYALLEGGPGDGSVVKPGDSVGDYKVASINQDSLILKKTVKGSAAEGTKVYTQVVPLTDSGQSGAAAFSAPTAAGRRGAGPGFNPGTGGLGAGKIGGGGTAE